MFAINYQYISSQVIMIRNSENTCKSSTKFSCAYTALNKSKHEMYAFKEKGTI